MMKRLKVFIEISGTLIMVGEILYSNFQDAVFGYSSEYLALDMAVPISVSLPLQKELFSSEQTKNFFEGLLPEGFTRRAVVYYYNV